MNQILLGCPHEKQTTQTLKAYHLNCDSDCIQLFPAYAAF